MDVVVVKAVRQYERRLEQAKKSSNKYYHANVHAISQQRVVDGIARGRTPTKGSVQKYDRALILNAWLEFVSSKTELSDRARAFHLYLTGSEFVPICSCV
jgi:hypothetical protein